MKDVLDVLNSQQFINILASYGFNVAGGRFEYEIVADPEALKAEVEIDRFLVSDVKLPLSDDYFYEKYGRPKPDNYDELVKQLEEKEKAALSSAGGGGADAPEVDQQKKPPKTPAKGAQQRLTFWEKIDLRIANFFDPGHKG